MKMTVLRAQRKLEMEVDLEHMTQVPNIDGCYEGITIYGHESKTGELYYVVLDRATVLAIQSMVLPPRGVDTTFPEIPID